MLLRHIQNIKDQQTNEILINNIANSVIERLNSDHKDKNLSIIPQEKHFPKPVQISAKKHNTTTIPSKFLSWKKCSILFWILVPDHKVGLRDARNYRYIISHNYSNQKEDANRFAIRYFSSDREWQIIISNKDNRTKRIKIEDHLEKGWHQFLISWNKEKPELIFRINKGENGSLSLSDLSLWPENLNESATVGAWTSAYNSSYIETQIHDFRIYNETLESDNPIVDAHFKIHPK